MENYSTCDLITQTVNKLFVYTDLQEWDKLQKEVFTEQVLYDMSSLGGIDSKLSAVEICRNCGRTALKVLTQSITSQKTI